MSYFADKITLIFQSCPGSSLLSYPGSEACRVLTLSNGTVFQQMVSPTELCTGKKYFLCPNNIFKSTKYIYSRSSLRYFKEGHRKKVWGWKWFVIQIFYLITNVNTQPVYSVATQMGVMRT